MKKTKDSSELSPSEALGLLYSHLEGKKKRVHTFDGFGWMLMGCDIDLSDLTKRLKSAEHICLAGKNMKGMGHGVAMKEKDKSYLFLETDRAKIESIYKKRKIVD